MSPFPTTLRRIRTERGLSVSQLSRRTRFSHTLILRLESGARDPTVNNLRRLSAALCESQEEREAFVVAGVLGKEMGR